LKANTASALPGHQNLHQAVLETLEISMTTKAQIETSIANKTALLSMARNSDERVRIENDLKDLRAALAAVDR
jgi:hypothetical protein